MIKPTSDAFDPPAFTEGESMLSFTPQNQSTVMNITKQNISKKLLSETSIATTMQGEFSIVKGYGGDHLANIFSVTNAHKQQGKDYVVYTITGQDNDGTFEVFRRYKEFNIFRNVLITRFPGLYVPPIPPKKAMDKSDKRLVEERTQMLNLFMKQLVRCPYLYESEEFRLFIRPHIPLE